MTKTPAPSVSRYFGAKPSQSRSPVSATTSAPSTSAVLRLSARKSTIFPARFTVLRVVFPLTLVTLKPQTRPVAHGKFPKTMKAFGEVVNAIIKQLWVVLLCVLVLVSRAGEPGPLKLVKTIPLPDVKGRIDHLAIDSKGKRLFVAALGNNTVE